MGRKSRAGEPATKLFTMRVTATQLEELHRRARAAGERSTSEWALRILLGPAGESSTAAETE